MPQDPSSTFGGLLAGCISDSYQKQDRKTLAEGVLFMILGAACSVITTYALSLAGVLV
jgi:sugar phosphate permease